MPRKKKSKNNEFEKGDLVGISSNYNLGLVGIIIDCDMPAHKYSFPWLVLRPNGFKKWERNDNLELIAKAKQ